MGRVRGVRCTLDGDGVVSNTWVDPDLARQGVTPRVLDILRDVALAHRARKLPAPGSSVVLDTAYEYALQRSWIVWLQVHEHYTSLADDHYVLTIQGRAVLDEQAAAERKLAGRTTYAVHYVHQVTGGFGVATAQAIEARTPFAAREHVYRTNGFARDVRVFDWLTGELLLDSD